MKKLILIGGLLVGALASGVAGPPVRPRQLGPGQADSLEGVLRRYPQADTGRVRLVISLLKAYRDTKPARRQALLNQALPLARRLGYARGLGRLYLEQGVVDKNDGRMSAARHSDSLALQALRLAGDSSGVASALDALGSVSLRESRFDAAAQLYTRALRLHERYSSPEVRATTLFNLGSVMSGINREEQAVEYYRQYLRLVKPADNPRNVSVAYRALAIAYNNLERYAEAVAAARAALPLVAQEPNEQSQAFNILGAIEDAAGHFDQSAAYQRQALALSRGYGSPREVMYALLGYGDAQLAQGQADAAIDSFVEAQALGQKIGDLSGQQQAHNGQARANKALGRYRAALTHAETAAVLTDSVLNETNMAQVNELQTRYETEKKEAQNQLLRQQKQLQAAQLRTQQQVIGRRNVQLIAGLVVTGLLAGLAYLLFTRRRLRREVEFAQERQRLDRQRTAAVLEAEEAERHRIGADLHDGVGQLLSVVKLNVDALSEELGPQLDADQAQRFGDALDLVDESVREVRGISHNLLPNALIKRGLARAVREFLEKIQRPGRLRIRLETLGLDAPRLDPVVENTLYRVIQELVQNIVKHAQASELTLHIIRHEAELTLLVEDNGVGFDPAVPAAGAGIGLHSVASRVAYLGGTLHLDSRPGHGTTVTASVPMSQAGAF